MSLPKLILETSGANSDVTFAHIPGQASKLVFEISSVTSLLLILSGRPPHTACAQIGVSKNGPKCSKCNFRLHFCPYSYRGLREGQPASGWAAHPLKVAGQSASGWETQRPREGQTAFCWAAFQESCRAAGFRLGSPATKGMPACVRLGSPAIKGRAARLWLGSPPLQESCRAARLRQPPPQPRAGQEFFASHVHGC
jgi:hypothetical protein